MVYEIRIQRTFCAAHQVRLPDGTLEPLHGHNWTVTVTVAADQLDGSGFVMDFHVLEKQLEGVLGPWNNRHLNETETFSRLNPSAENIAYQIARSLTLPERVRLVSVEITEAPGCMAVFRP